VVNSNRVEEILRLADGRELKYVQVESAFSNPNGHVNEKALDWICSAVRMATGGDDAEWYLHGCSEHRINNNSSSSSSSGSNGDKNNDNGNAINVSIDMSPSNSSCPSVRVTPPPLDPSSDVLELYCGNGNHTVAIAGGELMSQNNHLFCPALDFTLLRCAVLCGARVHCSILDCASTYYSLL
jgi:tRNA (Uracil-5-)-methyltransferase